MPDAQGILAGQAYVRIGADSSPLGKELGDAEGKLRDYEKTIRDLNVRIQAAQKGGNDPLVKTLQSQKQEAMAAYKDLAQATEQAGTQKSIERALFMATASSRDKALRENDEYFGSLRDKAGDNSDLLAKIDKAYVQKRDEILKGHGEGGGEEGGLLKKILGKEGMSTVKDLAGGLAGATYAAAGFALALKAGELIIDETYHSIYNAAGQLDKCAEISKKWLGLLTGLPLIGKYFEMALSDVSAQNDKIMQDWAQMKKLGDEVWGGNTERQHRLRTTLMSPLEKRQADIEYDRQEGLKKAASLRNAAETSASSVHLARNANPGAMEKYIGAIAGQGAALLFRYFTTPPDTTTETNQQKAVAKDLQDAINRQALLDEEQRRRDKEQQTGNLASDVWSSQLAATTLGKPWEESAARRWQEMIVRQQKEQFDHRNDSDIDKGLLSAKNLAEQAAMRKQFDDETVISDVQASERRMKTAERETAALKREYDSRRTTLQQLIETERDPLRRRILEDRLSDLGKERAIEEALLADQGRRQILHDAAARKEAIDKSILHSNSMLDQQQRFVIKGSFARADLEAKNQATLYRNQAMDAVENNPAFMPAISDTDAERAEKAAKKAEKIQGIETEAALMQKSGAESFRDQVHGWLETVKLPGERIQDFMDRLNEASQAGVLSDEQRQMLEARMGQILSLGGGGMGGSFNATLAYGFGPEAKLDNIATACQKTADNTATISRRLQSGDTLEH